MSYGWQTESAILPSKAKPIKVDSTSILGLKALVYNEEQKRSNKSGAQGKYLPGVHKIKQKINPDCNFHKIVTKNSNLVDSEKSDNKEERVVSSLTAKAKLYDEIMLGNISATPALVNFQTKSNYAAPAMQTTHMITQTDEFGRNMSDQYNWSKGEEVGGREEYLLEQQREREFKRTVDQTLGDMSDLNPPATRCVSASAKVKTQWEKTLNNSARGFLDQIHRETEVERLGVEGGSDSKSQGGSASSVTAGESRKRTMREERLEMLRQKQQKVNDTR